MVSQQYRAWPDCMDVQADLDLHWWHKLSTFGSSRLRVKSDVVFVYTAVLIEGILITCDYCTTPPTHTVTPTSYTYPATYTTFIIF